MHPFLSSSSLSCPNSWTDTSQSSSTTSSSASCPLACWHMLWPWWCHQSPKQSWLPYQNDSILHRWWSMPSSWLRLKHQEQISQHSWHQWSFCLLVSFQPSSWWWLSFSLSTSFHSICRCSEHNRLQSKWNVLLTFSFLLILRIWSFVWGHWFQNGNKRPYCELFWICNSFYWCRSWWCNPKPFTYLCLLWCSWMLASVLESQSCDILAF